MDLAAGAIAAQWVATIAVTGSLCYTIYHNGKRGAKQDIELKTELKADIKTIKDKLDDPKDGLKAISREVAFMREHCASVTSSFTERIKRAESDITEIKHEDRS
jgi:hypothetical protein